MTHRHAVPAALLLGLLAAAPADAATPPRLPAPILAAPAPAPACPATPPSAGRAAPAGVTQAFGILRRARTGEDALPAVAVRALRRAGLDVPDPTVARRLRQAGRGTAWVVPVADLRPLLQPFGCVRRAPRPARPRPVPARPAVPAPRPSSAPRPARAPRPSAPPVLAPPPALPLLAAPVQPARVLRGPQPGVVVVAQGDVLGGGGGTLHDLRRGLAAPVVTPCAGPRDDLVGVSGVVPDGVDAVYLTTTDGSAVRADVAENGYAFHVPPPPSRTAMRVTRYVVWTGTDGLPHVHPVLLPRMPDRACSAYQRGITSRLALDPAGFALPVVVSPARAPARP